MRSLLANLFAKMLTADPVFGPDVCPSRSVCRQWKNRVKGRDWYDLIWYAANHPRLHLSHLEQRMIQSGHLKQGEQMTPEKFFALTTETIDKLDVNQARKEVEPFVKNLDALEVWSGEFFQDVVRRIVLV